MNIYEKNFQALKKFRPDLAKKVESYKSNGKYNTISSNHPDKIPNLIYLPEKLLAYDNNDPLAYVQADLRNKIRLPVLNIFFGFGLGYEILTFLQKFAVQESVLIVFEPEFEPFYVALYTIDLTPVISDSRVKLLIDIPINDVFVNLHAILFMGNLKLFVKAINIIDNSLSLRLNGDYYKKVMSHLKDAVKEVLLHFGNDPWDSLIGIVNTFLNINEIIGWPGIKDLEGIFDGKPGIVVATGPSLNKNIHLLKGLENKAVICAADASLRIMKKNGLKPHLVTSLERVIATSKLFEGLTQEDVKDVYLSACPVIRPETYTNFPGERIIVYRNFATFQWLEIEKGTLDIGPSAANMAFKILEFLGCNPIILIGQDLAFGENEVTHASGATFGEKEEQYHTKRQILEVEGNYVPKIKTTDVWYKFMKYYEKDIAGFKGEVINATEGGAKIYGTKIMTFKEAIEKYINEDISVIDNIKSNLKYPDEAEKEKYKKQSMDKVNEAIQYSENVIERLTYGFNKAVEFINNVIVRYEKEKVIDEEYARKTFDEVQKTLAIFGERKFFEIFMHFVQSYYLTTIIEINGVRNSNNHPRDINFTVVKLLYDMYGVMIKLIEAMKKSLYEMKAKLEEN
ncbi:motility associated factor glycosyltransferase family protein [Deferribacteraceae bacterium V6Fe1]|nr:motility associated factor glycosyltransferase family protein [Deferribacteraceae bacterium V6Fe1]